MYFLTKKSRNLEITEISQNAMDLCGLDSNGARVLEEYLTYNGMHSLSLEEIIPGINQI
jgi:hypothetical protein